MRISDWSSDVCSSDRHAAVPRAPAQLRARRSRCRGHAMTPAAAHDGTYTEGIDPTVSCGNCDAVCCRLTVILMPEDRVPRDLTTRTAHGLEVMARDEEGWCVAVDQNRMRSEEHTSELQSLMRISYAVFGLKK